MTAQELWLCGLLLQEHFGEDSTVLVSSGRRGPGSPVRYRASCERVLSVLRYIYTAKTLYGDTGELIVEEVLQRGHMTLSNTVKTVADRLTHNMEEGRSMEYSEVVSAFSKLVETHFLQRCPPVAEMGTAATSTAPPTAESNPDCYTLPHVTLIGCGKRRRSSDDSEEQRGGKKVKMDSESCGDEGIYWQVNFERFHQHFRDQAIISAVASKLDQVSVTDPYRPPRPVVRTMLRMSEVTTTQTAADTQPLSANEIFRSLLPNYSISRPILDQYLSLLVDDPMEFVGKSGNLEQKQVEDFAMIPAKEAKDMLYTLLSENLVQLQEIPKTPDHAPSRTFYLYTVNQLPTARLLLQGCVSTVANLIERRLFETKENKRLLEKSQRIEAILASLQASGAEPEQLTGWTLQRTRWMRLFLLESYIFSTKTK
ncbi:DNA-directed RNA polymerase III subunit RPC3-like [Oncorhynchus nerka]|uniref:DNA-directed RNA polymerase III subunit RPC3-like n=1 Tax=Oncorhynchus nerka TaxID=8023 RepID=UPI0031B8ADBA